MVYLPKIVKAILLLLQPFSTAMNSDSIVERAIHVYLKDSQDTAAPPRVNTFPLVDFDSSESVIQLASLYPSSTSRYCPYLKAYSLIYDT